MSNTNSVAKPLPMEEIQIKPEKITSLLNSRQDAELTCYGCEKDLWGFMIDAYPNPNGWKVPGMDELQWLSIHCPKCGHDNSLTNFRISKG